MALAADGWSLLLSGWPAYDEGQGLPQGDGGHIEELLGVGVAVETVECDLAQPDAARQLFDVAETLGPVLGLVNNAAHSERTVLAQLDAGTLDRHYRVNLRAPALLAREFAARFQGGSGRIVNMTSGQGITPMPGELAYAATKGGLEALTLSLAAALAPKGITVNAVDPGPTDSGWMTAEQQRSLIAPLGRVGLPQDAARLVTFLMSEGAGWITGQVIRSRGGS